MHSHNACIFVTSPHCLSSSVSSNFLPERMKIHTGYIWLSFLHCIFLYVLHIACMRRCKLLLVTFVSLFSFDVGYQMGSQSAAQVDANSHWLHLYLFSQNYTGCIWLTFSPLYIIKWVFRLLAWKDTSSHCLHLLVVAPNLSPEKSLRQNCII